MFDMRHKRRITATLKLFWTQNSFDCKLKFRDILTKLFLINFTR